MPTPGNHPLGGGNNLDVQVLAPGDHRRAAALTLAFCGAVQLPAEARRQAEGLVETAERQGLGLNVLVAAYAGGRLLAAALAMESPGRSVMVQTTLPQEAAATRGALAAVLRVLARTTAERGARLLQALVLTDDQDLAEAYRLAGFRYLTDLLYLDLSIGAERARDLAPAGVALATYSSELHEIFIRALDDSYVASMDCPGLTGLRATKDVLSGHRATGVFDPKGWYVALREREPIGVLLTAQLPQRGALEIVYIGVCCAVRGQGVGNYLLQVALRRAEALSASIITLAVDATNEPARALYARWGFCATHRRRVWIVTPAELANSS